MYGAPSFPTSRPRSERLPMELPKNVIRIGEQAIWSTFRYPYGTPLTNQESRVFTTPQGQVGQGFAVALSIAETSQKVAGQIPGGYAYNAFGISLHPYYIGGQAAGAYALDGADLRNVHNNCVVTWDFQQTRIPIAPAVLVGTGGGAFGTTADTAGSEGGAGGSRVALNNGNGAIWTYMQHPVMLPTDSVFALLLQWGANAAAVDGGGEQIQAALAMRLALLGMFENAIAIG